MSRVTIVDTGVANLASITAAFGRLEAEVERTSEADAVGGAERLVLPGVGHFGAGRRALAERGLDEAVVAAVEAGTPLLGICLGYQLLTAGSDEAPNLPGLAILPGRCVRLPAEARVPHLGWSWVEAAGMRSVAPGWAAFAHSFAVPAAAGGRGMAVTRHGTAFVAAVERGSVTGCQFHPELSGTWGQALLARWLGRGPAEANGSPGAAGGWGADRVARRVVPCLDVRGGRIVKGIRFTGLRDAGDPAERAAEYERQGADEIVILDVSASVEERRAAEDTVRRVRNVLGIPLTVGGGVRAVEDAARLLTAGADKISVNTAAVERPELLTDLAREFGEQCVVLAIDARREGDDWEVLTHGGRRPRDLRAVAWAEDGWRRGAGEILLTSWDRDGTGEGCDEALLRAVSDRVGVPVIASGGVGRPEHAVGALSAGADAVLAATILHDGKDTVAGLKQAMAGAGFEVRP